MFFFILTPISQFSFYIKALKRLYLAQSINPLCVILNDMNKFVNQRPFHLRNMNELIYLWLQIGLKMTFRSDDFSIGRKSSDQRWHLVLGALDCEDKTLQVFQPFLRNITKQNLPQPFNHNLANEPSSLVEELTRLGVFAESEGLDCGERCSGCRHSGIWFTETDHYQ